MNRIETIVVRLWRITVGGLLLAVTALTVTQVVARYGFNSSLTWSEELNRLLYVWMILLAAAGADHMRIGLIADRPRFSVPFRWFGAIAAAAALVLLVWGGWRLQAMFAFDRYTTLDLSKSWYFAAAIAGGSLWLVASLFAAARGKTVPEDGSEDPRDNH